MLLPWLRLESVVAFAAIARPEEGLLVSLPLNPGKRKDSLGNCCSRPDFLDLPPEALRRFNDIAREIACSGGSILFREGGPTDAIYVVSTGLVKLFAATSDGRRMILKIAKLGDVLGLSAMLNGVPHEVTAETLGPCHFKHVSQSMFLSFLEEHTGAAYTAARMLAKEHHELVFRVRHMGLSRTVAGRIAHILVDFASSEGSSKLASSFPMVLTHAEVASLAGASRETVTRLLNQFERDGIIARNNAAIRILKPAVLKQLAY